MQRMKGLTFVGMLLTMAAVIVLGLLAMRVTPVYIAHYTVTHSLSTLSTLPTTNFSTDDPAENATIIKRSLMKQFEVNGIDDITEANITIQPNEQHQLIVTIKYQVTRPFIGNISLLFDFNDSQEVTIGRE